MLPVEYIYPVKIVYLIYGERSGCRISTWVLRFAFGSAAKLDPNCITICRRSVDLHNQLPARCRWHVVGKMTYKRHKHIILGRRIRENHTAGAGCRYGPRNRAKLYDRRSTPAARCGFILICAGIVCENLAGCWRCWRNIYALYLRCITAASAAAAELPPRAGMKDIWQIRCLRCIEINAGC